jgi:hypothetical protein
MISQTLSSCFGKACNNEFHIKLCTNYPLKHFDASIIGKIKLSKVAIIYHHLLSRYGCIGITPKWFTWVHSCQRLNLITHFNSRGIPPVKCIDTQFFHTLLYTYFKSILGQLSPPGKEAVFIRRSGCFGTPWGVRMQRIFHQRVKCCSFSPGVALSAGIGTFTHKYLRPFGRWLYPPGKEMKFNRMNGSPGDPPGNLMHRLIHQRIVPFVHRLAGDPTSMEAGWETNIGDTNHVNKHIN